MGINERMEDSRRACVSESDAGQTGKGYCDRRSQITTMYGKNSGHDQPTDRPTVDIMSHFLCDSISQDFIRV